MNLTPDSDPTSTPESTSELQYRSLRRLIQATGVSVLILTGTLFVFIYRQVVLVRRQSVELGRYLTEVDRAGVQDFAEQVRAKLNDFRKQHPDFAPIYARYFGTSEPPQREKVSAVPQKASSTNPLQKAPGK